MRRKRAAIALTLVVAAFAVGAPVLLAIQEAQRQGRAIETERVLGYARDVLMRTDATAAQVDRGFKLLEAARDGAPCSDANIDLMRQIDLTSSYLHAIGYVEDGRIACSSIGGDRKDLLIGTPDFVTANGVAIYKNLRLRFAPQLPFIALARITMWRSFTRTCRSTPPSAAATCRWRYSCWATRLRWHRAISWPATGCRGRPSRRLAV